MKQIPEEKLEAYIEKLSDSIYGQVIRQVLKKEMDRLDTVMGVRSLEESLGREIAIRHMQSVLNRLVPSDDKKEKMSEYE